MRRALSYGGARRQLGFNPRTHTECDNIRDPVVIRTIISIHAPYRVRLQTRTAHQAIPEISIHALIQSATSSTRNAWQKNTNFNPRTHTECDNCVVARVFMFVKFQSTHSYRVRRVCRKLLQAFKRISIHALIQSATQSVSLPLWSLKNFNPRTHTECDFCTSRIITRC